MDGSTSTVLVKETSLYFTDSGSDKEYHCQIAEKGGGFTVNFQYGRRGSTLTPGTKTKEPVTLEAATKIFDKLVKEKTSKGYTQGEAGTPYVGTDNAERVTGLQVQLLNPIEEADLSRYLGDPAFGLQEKLDGKRMLIVFDNGQDVTTYAVNRSGLKCGAPEPVLIKLRDIAIGKGFDDNTNKIILDGEAIGDEFFAFDLLHLGEKDMRPESYASRHFDLQKLLPAEGYQQIIAVPLALNAGKGNVFEEIRAAGKEGVVFKRLDAAYTPGRPNSGGTQFKYKFQHTATCEVLKLNNGKRSFEVGCRDAEGELTFVGNVTVPANMGFPRAGQCVEIRYLYAYRDGSLFQPLFLGLRDDKLVADQIDSLKFKGEVRDEK